MSISPNISTNYKEVSFGNDFYLINNKNQVFKNHLYGSGFEEQLADKLLDPSRAQQAF